jgi:hypothetical protein
MDDPAANPFAMTLTEFERQVAVPTETRSEMVGEPAVSTPLSGDEAAVMRWNGAGSVGPGDSMGDGGDGDC